MELILNRRDQKVKIQARAGAGKRAGGRRLRIRTIENYPDDTQNLFSELGIVLVNAAKEFFLIDSL